MSSVSIADYQDVDDRELARAVDAADPACVNGLPDRQAIAAECDLSPKRVANRLRDLADEGHVAIHESLRLDVAGERSSYELLCEPSDVDPDARTVESPRFEPQYDAADCWAALERVVDVAGGHVTCGEYRGLARDSEPSPRVITDRLDRRWEQAVAAAQESES